VRERKEWRATAVSSLAQLACSTMQVVLQSVGKSAQRALRKWSRSEPDEYLFGAQESLSEHGSCRGRTGIIGRVVNQLDSLLLKTLAKPICTELENIPRLLAVDRAVQLIQEIRVLRRQPCGRWRGGRHVVMPDHLVTLNMYGK